MERLESRIPKLQTKKITPKGIMNLVSNNMFSAIEDEGFNRNTEINLKYHLVIMNWVQDQITDEEYLSFMKENKLSHFRTYQK